jgi:23S rRNA (uridine2552-2'-O)-methyltransferase
VKRTNSSARWLNEHFNDHYVKQAKKEGYRSRAAFKLLEIHAKDHLLKPNMTVIDLGAAPGGWSLIAKQKVGERGQVFALDILPMAPLAGVDFLQGDFNEEAVIEELLKRVDNHPIDLVMSDMSPNISGIAAIDQPRAFQLNEQALELARQALRPGGNFLIKVFQGQGFDAFLKDVRAYFSKVHIRKPKSSRDRSHEMYLVCIGKL